MESERCQLVVDAGQSVLTLTDLPPGEWSPDQADLLADDLDEERVEELRAGAKPDSEELELWEGEIEALWDITTTLEIYRVAHSQRPENRAFVGWVSQTSGQSGDTLAWAGPYPNCDQLVSFAIGQTREWRLVGLNFDPISITKIEEIEESDALDGDDQDRTQADLVFQAVKTARAGSTSQDRS